jgi:Cysteine rich repeat
MPRLASMIAVLLMANATPLFAQVAPNAAGTAAPPARRVLTAEEKLCRNDVARLCRQAAGDDMVVLSCLKDHRDRLSHGCRSVLVTHGQ